MADTSCSGIISNPDLVGIGTCINFYVMILLAAAVPQHRYTNKLLDELYTNTVFYGLALLITVLIQTIKRQLDLYHAIFVIHVVLCLTVFQFYGFSRFPSAKRKNFKVKTTLLAQSCQVLIIMPPWMLYVWIKDSRFGAQPECNHLVKYVFFFVSVRATVSWLRIFFIVVASLGLVYASLKALFKLKALRRAGSHAASDDESGIEFDTYTFLIWLISVMFAVYGVVTTELIVHRNRPNVQGGEDSWGFGQVISVLLVLPIFIELVAILKRVGTT